MPVDILVVEDEPAIQELIAVNLAHAGHRVLRARDAEGALEILRGALAGRNSAPCSRPRAWR